MGEEEKPRQDSAAEQDPTRGDRPFRPTLPKVEIGDREVELRRLDWRAIRDFADVMERADAALPPGVLDAAGGEGPEAIGALLQRCRAIIAHGGEQLERVLAAVLGVEPQELVDADRFPGDGLLRVVMELVSHPDVASFFFAGATGAHVFRSAARSRTRSSSGA